MIEHLVKRTNYYAHISITLGRVFIHLQTWPFLIGAITYRSAGLNFARGLHTAWSRYKLWQIQVGSWCFAFCAGEFGPDELAEKPDEWPDEIEIKEKI